MNATHSAVRAARRGFALSALAGAVLATTLGVATDQAKAAYTAKVRTGTLSIAGDAASDKLVLIASSTTLALDVGADGTADFTFERSAFTAIAVAGGRGNDEISVVGDLVGEALTLDGGPGDDVLSGSNGADRLVGGPGDDVIDGQQGADTALLGGDNDRFKWDPGDGSDTVEGERGNDLLDFNGSSISETIGISASGGRVRFARDVAGVVTDLDGVEGIAFDSFGGADTIAVNDLTGTDAKTVDVDLNAAGGGGDGQPDTVVVKGTDGSDAVSLSSSDERVVVAGLGAQTRVAGSEPAGDVVSVRTLGGADTITAGVGVSGPESINVDGGDAADTVEYSGSAGADTIGVSANGTEVSTGVAGTSRVDTTAVESVHVLGLAGADTIGASGNLVALTKLTIDGGADADGLSGGNGNDLILGGTGNDWVDGQQGADVAQLGDGNDRFLWGPGDASDVVEGQGDDDLLEFDGASIGESFAVSASGGRVRVTRDIANVVSELDDVEQIRLHAYGGADTVVVDDLTGTDVRSVDVYLGADGSGAGDGQADTVIARGTDGPDLVNVGSAAADVVVSGLSPTVRIQSAEAADDTLSVQTLAGDDTVTVAPGVIDLIMSVIDLGAGE